MNQTKPQPKKQVEPKKKLGLKKKAVASLTPSPGGPIIGTEVLWSACSCTA